MLSSFLKSEIVQIILTNFHWILIFLIIKIKNRLISHIIHQPTFIIPVSECLYGLFILLSYQGINVIVDSVLVSVHIITFILYVFNNTTNIPSIIKCTQTSRLLAKVTFRIKMRRSLVKVYSLACIP